MAGSQERHTIQAWGTRLSGEGEQLTRQEAQLLSSMAAADRLVEMQASLLDMQIRLRRMEIFLSEVFPAYDGLTRQAALSPAAHPPQPNGVSPESRDVVAVSRTVPDPSLAGSETPA